MTIDQTVLTEEAYADNSRLADRIAIYEWQRPKFDLPGLAMRTLGTPNGPVLDVGWGTGTHTNRIRAEHPDVRVVPIDLSAGMRPEIVGEVDRLPFATGSAGTVLAMHMLYYATDPAAAVRELRRVLRPGGKLLASTNGSTDKAERDELWQAALRDLGEPNPPPYPFDDRRFSLEHGAELIGEVFGNCDVYEHRYELVVPEPGPVVAYLHSARDAARQLPTGISWPRFMVAVERRVRERIERTGAFRMAGHVGVLSAVA